MHPLAIEEFLQLGVMLADVDEQVGHLLDAGALPRQPRSRTRLAQFDIGLVPLVAWLLQLVEESQRLEAGVEEGDGGQLVEHPCLAVPVEHLDRVFHQRAGARPGAGEVVRQPVFHAALLVDRSVLRLGHDRLQQFGAFGIFLVRQRRIGMLAAGEKDVEKAARLGVGLGLFHRRGVRRRRDFGVIVGKVACEPVVQFAVAQPLVGQLVQVFRPPQRLLAGAAQFGETGHVLVRVDRLQPRGIGRTDRLAIGGRLYPQYAPREAAAHSGLRPSSSSSAAVNCSRASAMARGSCASITEVKCRIICPM